MFKRLKINLKECLIDIVIKQGELLDEMLVEPYGTTRYEILKLHLAILDFKVSLIKELLMIK